MTNIIFLSSIIVASCAYRAGGMPRPFRTWMRDWLIPLIGVIALYSLGVKAIWWAHLISYGLLGAALSTYIDDSDNLIKDFLARMINWMYPKDNFYLHGFLIGLAYFPYAISNELWVPLILRAIILGVLMGGLNYLVHKLHIPFSDWVEELFRGGIIIITLPILLI